MKEVEACTKLPNNPRMNSMMLFTVLCLILIFPQSILGLSYSGEYNNGEDTFELSIQIDANKTTVSMTGPSNQWLSVGFGSLTMDDSYNVVYGKDEDDTPLEIWETYTTGHGEGDYIQQCSGQTCAQLESVSTVDGETTVIFTRNNNEGGSRTYQFDPSATQLETIWGIGKEIKYDEHSDTNYGAVTIVFGTFFLRFFTYSDFVCMVCLQQSFMSILYQYIVINFINFFLSVALLLFVLVLFCLRLPLYMLAMRFDNHTCQKKKKNSIVKSNDSLVKMEKTHINCTHQTN